MQTSVYVERNLHDCNKSAYARGHIRVTLTSGTHVVRMEDDAVGSGLFLVAVFLTNQLQIMKFLGMHSFLVYSYFLFSAEGSDIFSAPCSRTL